MWSSKFSFFKAGQGAFYGGRIYDHDNKRFWTIVYDCGTSNFVRGNTQSLNDEITVFQQDINHLFEQNNTIDVLFISHLDYDHVSGVARLLRECQVKKVVIPYFPKEARQYAIFSISTDEDDPLDPQFSLEDYTSFLQNPYDFIQNTGGDSEKRKVYVVTGEETEKYNPEPFGDDFDENQDGVNIFGDRSTLTIEETDGLDNVFKFKNNVQVFVEKRWEFTTYFKDISESTYKGLRNCLIEKLGKTLITEKLDRADIDKLVTVDRTKAHKCYKKHLSDINAHGLILLHGPIEFSALESKLNVDYYDNWSWYFDDYYVYRRMFFGENSSFLGTLLLGDITLNGPHAIQFPSYFEERFKDVHVYQVPHHGSDKNWNPSLRDQMNLGNDPIAVCNFGYGNTFGHPGPTVMRDLAHQIVLNSQFLRFDYHYKIQY